MSNPQSSYRKRLVYYIYYQILFYSIQSFRISLYWLSKCFVWNISLQTIQSFLVHQFWDKTWNYISTMVLWMVDCLWQSSKHMTRRSQKIIPILFQTRHKCPKSHRNPTPQEILYSMDFLLVFQYYAILSTTSIILSRQRIQNRMLAKICN